MKKDIIILTKSDKRAGYCVAGIDKSTGEWIRLVSSNSAAEHAVPGNHLFCDDGKIVDIYDIVEIEIKKAVPTDVQPENYLYDEDIDWKKKGKSNLREVLQIHGYDNTEYIFGNTDNRLTQDEVHLAEKSLLLLRVDEPVYFVKCFPERTVLQLNFKYNSIQYSYFKVTQSDLKEQYNDYKDGRYQTKTDVFVFSLTDRFKDGRYYKVVAQALM